MTRRSWLVVRGSWLILAVILTASSAHAEDSTFYKGNELYKEGKYSEAAAEYEKIPASGYESGSLYYNLGNAYFKTGRLGKAVLNYERAKRLMPRDGDLESNYKHAMSLVESSDQKRRGLWYLRFIYNTFEQFTVNELVILLSTLYILIIITLVLSIFVNAKDKTLAVIVVSAAIFAAAFISAQSKVSAIGRDAIVMIESTEARFEPSDRGTTHFTLYEGMKVDIVSQRGDWSKIERLDGKNGWIKSDSLEVI